MNLRGWLHGGIGAVALVLAGINIWLGESNRAAALPIEAQRSELARVERIAGIDNSLIQLLVKTAAEQNDADLRALLAANGVTFKLNAAAAGSAPQVSAPAP